MPVFININQQAAPLAQGEARKQQEHHRRAIGLRLFCHTLHFSWRATFKSLCPLAFLWNWVAKLVCGKQRKALTHSFYQDCYSYEVCMLYKPGRDQNLLEIGVQSFTQSLSYCHTTESPQKWPVFSSFPLPFTAEPPSAEPALCRILMWIQSMKRVLALHTQDSSIVWDTNEAVQIRKLIYSPQSISFRIMSFHTDFHNIQFRLVCFETYLFSSSD